MKQLKTFEDFVNGQCVTLTIGKDDINGVITIENGEIYFLSNCGILDGCSVIDRKGYKYSWYLGSKKNDIVCIVKLIEVEVEEKTTHIEEPKERVTEIDEIIEILISSYWSGANAFQVLADALRGVHAGVGLAKDDLAAIEKEFGFKTIVKP